MCNLSKLPLEIPESLLYAPVTEGKDGGVMKGGTHEDINSLASTRIGKAVARRRVELGHPSARSLARESGLDYRTITAVENGRRPEIDRNTATRLEAALKWPPGTISSMAAGSTDVVLHVQGTPRADVLEAAIIIAQVSLDSAVKALTQALDKVV